MDYVVSMEVFNIVCYITLFVLGIGLVIALKKEGDK